MDQKKTSVCKEWRGADEINGSLERATNHSHRHVAGSRSRSPQRWRGSTSGELALPFQQSNYAQESQNNVFPFIADRVPKQSTRRNRDPRLAKISSAASPHQPIQQDTDRIQQAMPIPSQKWISTLKIAIDPADGLPALLSHSTELTGHAANSMAGPAHQPVPPIQKEKSRTPQAVSIAPGQPVHTFKIASDPSDGHYVILSHSVQPNGHAANSVVDPSKSTQVQPRGGVKAKETHDDNKTKARRLFATALKELVIKQIEKIRDQHQSTQELCVLVMQKTVDNIMRSEKNIPIGRQRIGMYLSSYRPKINKLIQEYFQKYTANPLW